MRAYAVLRVRDTPHGHEPPVETERRILENGSNFGRELFTTTFIFALKHPATGNVADPITATLWARDLPIGPPYRDHVPMAHVQVREESNRLKQRLRCVVCCVHAIILTGVQWTTSGNLPRMKESLRGMWR